jgi:hypothetical protein
MRDIVAFIRSCAWPAWELSLLSLCGTQNSESDAPTLDIMRHPFPVLEGEGQGERPRDGTPSKGAGDAHTHHSSSG